MGLMVQLAVVALYQKVSVWIERLMQYFFIMTALLEIQCLLDKFFCFSFLVLWLRLILEVIGSYKHIVYYVMQIGAISLASML